jgi:cardiolipin synthase A/B
MRSLSRIFWLVLAFALGAIAMLLVMLLTREAQVNAARASGNEPVIGDTQFVQAVQRFTGADWTEGNTVEVLFNGNQTYPRLWSDLRAARTTITFHDFWMRGHAMPDSLAQILAERARAGVRVLFLYDAFGAHVEDAYFEGLRKAGVTVAELRPMRLFDLARAQHRSHMRAVVIDATIAYTGGFGIDSLWKGGGQREGEWRDTNVRLTGPIVDQVQTAFMSAWGEASGKLLTGQPFFGARRLPTARGVQTAFVYSPATVGSSAAERLIALTITGARSRLWITNAYFAPEDDLRHLLISAAKRGVDVRVLTAGEKTDQANARYAGRANYDQLLRGGVRIYEYDPSMVHAKTIVADGRWSVISTINFDNRSLALNDEVALITPDPRIALQLETAYADDLTRSTAVTLARFQKRSPYERGREWFATLLLRFL